MRFVFPCLLWAMLLAAACTGTGANQGGDDKDTGTSDGDADGDSDGDADGDTDSENVLDIEWVFVEGGTFMMGTDAGEPEEQPVHEVTVSDFEIMKAEVTAEEYGACLSNLDLSNLD